MSGGSEGCDRGMNASGFQLSRLRDCRLAPLATSALPAWLWSTDATRIVWANPIGAAMFGAPTSAAIAARTFGTAEPAAAQIARLAGTLSLGASPRLERLRGLGLGMGDTLTCACSHIVLSDDTPAILVVAAERAGPDLPLGERVARLLAGAHEPIAAFATDGNLIAATDTARPHLRGATALATLGALALAADALASGHAAGTTHGDQISIDRVGCGAATVLIANFAAPGSAGDIRRHVPDRGVCDSRRGTIVAARIGHSGRAGARIGIAQASPVRITRDRATPPASLRLADG